MSQGTVVSLSSPETLRLPGITYNLNGNPATDPRPLFTPTFQLLAPGTTEFGDWADGEWDGIAPPNGPYGATITIGPGQPDAVNPGEAGVYRMWCKLQPVSDAGEMPAFPVGIVELTTP